MRFAVVAMIGGLVLSTFVGRGDVARHDLAASAKPSASTEWGWRTLGTWSGSKGMQTESFTSDTGVFRVSWKATRAQNSEPPLLRVIINSAVSGRPLLYPVNVQAPGEDVVYVREDPRIYYAEIDATGFDWSLTIQDGVAGVAVPRAVPGAGRAFGGAVRQMAGLTTFGRSFEPDMRAVRIDSSFGPRGVLLE